MRTIIVTGDSSGLGAAITEMLLKSNEYVVVGVSRSSSEDRLIDTGHENYVPIEFDLSDVSNIEHLYKEKLKDHGPVHGLVNNAALGYDDIITNVDFERLSQLFAVNVYAPMILTKWVLRDMLLHQTEGSLVHISSISTTTGYKGLSMYGATKGALEAFSKNIAREWGERGIRSNVVAPGFMETAMTAGLDDEQRERIYDRTALQQPTDPQDVAAAVEYLLSDAANSVTGELLRVDSGTV